MQLTPVRAIYYGQWGQYGRAGAWFIQWLVRPVCGLYGQVKAIIQLFEIFIVDLTLCSIFEDTVSKIPHRRLRNALGQC